MSCVDQIFKPGLSCIKLYIAVLVQLVQLKIALRPLLTVKLFLQDSNWMTLALKSFVAKRTCQKVSHTLS